MIQDPTGISFGLLISLVIVAGILQVKYDEFGKFLSYFSEPTTTVKSWNGRSLDISFVYLQ